MDNPHSGKSIREKIKSLLESELWTACYERGWKAGFFFLFFFFFGMVGAGKHSLVKVINSFLHCQYTVNCKVTTCSFTRMDKQMINTQFMVNIWVFVSVTTKHHIVIILHLFLIKYLLIIYLRHCQSHSLANVKLNMLPIQVHGSMYIIQTILMAPTMMKDSPKNHPLKDLKFTMPLFPLSICHFDWLFIF